MSASMKFAQNSAVWSCCTRVKIRRGVAAGIAQALGEKYKQAHRGLLSECLFGQCRNRLGTPIDRLFTEALAQAGWVEPCWFSDGQ